MRPLANVLSFDLDVATLDLLERTYEQAGLFAWREMLAQVCQWDRWRLEESVQHAIRTMPRGAHAALGPERFLLFDP